MSEFMLTPHEGKPVWLVGLGVDFKIACKGLHQRARVAARRYRMIVTIKVSTIAGMSSTIASGDWWLCADWMMSPCRPQNIHTISKVIQRRSRRARAYWRGAFSALIGQG